MRFEPSTSWIFARQTLNKTRKTTGFSYFIIMSIHQNSFWNTFHFRFSLIIIKARNTVLCGAKFSRRIFTFQRYNFCFHFNRFISIIFLIISVIYELFLLFIHIDCAHFHLIILPCAPDTKEIPFLPDYKAVAIETFSTDQQKNLPILLFLNLVSIWTFRWKADLTENTFQSMAMHFVILLRLMWYILWFEFSFDEL